MLKVFFSRQIPKPVFSFNMSLFSNFRLQLCVSVLSPSLCQSRNLGKLTKVVYPWMNRRKPYWVDQNCDPCVESDITKENKDFLEDERVKCIRKMQNPFIHSTKIIKKWIPFETQRCGLVGLKLGIYPMWSKCGEKIDCTVLQIPDNHALRYIPPSEIDNYLSLRDPRGNWLNNKQVPSWICQKRWGLQIVGAMSADPLEFTAEWCGLFTSAGVATKRKITRFLVSPDAALEPGTPLSINHFRVGDYVDVTARTINRGFQGVIERWGMSGGPAAHGSTKFHRRIGSLGGAGRKIIRAKKMHGVMGNRFRSLRGLQILRMNPRLNLIYLSGPTPGPVHSFCLLHDSWLINRQHAILKNPPPNPTWFSDTTPVESGIEMETTRNRIITTADLDDLDLFDDFADDIYHESIHRYDEPSINSTSS